MRDTLQPDCPRTEQLSALIDGELAGATRGEIAVHAESCPLCSATLNDLNELRVAMRSLSATRAGLDLSSLVERRLAARRPPERRARGGSWWHGWQILPSGLAAAGMLTAGIYLGAVLAGGTAVMALQPAAMALFDPVPPGGLCVGLQSCYPLGR
ncbi:MAG: zf-HC2 domain-containing protein [Betaproteobacteria bacterium]|nr:zf-HC2 domain-containing protein [Betaproteobacteria bacterium]